MICFWSDLTCYNHSCNINYLYNIMNPKYNFEQYTFCCYCACDKSVNSRFITINLIIKVFPSFRNKNVQDLPFFPLNRNFALSTSIF